MKAAVVEALGRPPVYADFTEPSPRGGAVVITVEASALTNLTRGLMSGKHTPARRYSFRLSPVSTVSAGLLTAGWCTRGR